MSNNILNILNKKTVTNKTFTYNKRGANLSFTVNIENKAAMKDLVEILVKAVEDVNTEIKK
jgi:hypothetical protein